MKKLVNGELVDLTPQEITAREAEEALSNSKQLEKFLPAYRFEREVGGFQVLGLTIPSDEKTERRIIGARVKAEANPSYVIQDWTTDGGLTSTTLTAEMIIAISDAFDAHIQKCFTAMVSVRENISNYTTAEQIKTAFDTAYGG